MLFKDDLTNNTNEFKNSSENFLEGIWNDVVQVGGKVADGAAWVGGKIVDGATWVGDKVVDGAVWVYNHPLEATQGALDITGLAPGIGEFADGANAVIYAANGDYVNAGLSAGAMIPFVGMGATAGKIGGKVANAAVDAAKIADAAGGAAKIADAADDAAKIADVAGDATKKVTKAKIGTNFGKLGVLIANNGKQIVDWKNISTHGLERMTERRVTQKMVNSWVKTGKALEQSGGKILYIEKEGAAVIDKTGKLITAYTSKEFDKNMMQVVERLFGN